MQIRQRSRFSCGYWQVHPRLLKWKHNSQMGWSSVTPPWFAFLLNKHLWCILPCRIRVPWSNCGRQGRHCKGWVRCWLCTVTPLGQPTVWRIPSKMEGRASDPAQAPCVDLRSQLALCCYCRTLSITPVATLWTLFRQPPSRWWRSQKKSIPVMVPTTCSAHKITKGCSNQCGSCCFFEGLPTLHPSLVLAQLLDRRSFWQISGPSQGCPFIWCLYL